MGVSIHDLPVELLRDILAVVDDPVVPQFVCKLWKIHNISPAKCTNYSELVAARGYIGIIDWIYGMYHPRFCEVASAAACHNQVGVLQWLVDHQYELPKTDYYKLTEYGHLATIEWSLRRSYAKCSYQLGDFSDYACRIFAYYLIEIAIAQGHLHILKWLYSHSFVFSTSDVNHVIGNGNLEVLSWMMFQCKQCCYDGRALHTAIKENQPHVVSWLIDNGIHTAEDLDYYVKPVAVCNVSAHCNRLILRNRSKEWADLLDKYVPVKN